MSMMDRKFIVILEDCLSRLDRGEILLKVLESYPDLEERLKPILLIAMLSRALPQPVPKPAAIRKGKNLMLREMNLMQAEKTASIPKSRQPAEKVMEGWLGNIPNPFQPDRVGSLNLSYRLAIVAVVLVLGGSFLTLTASASGLPGGVFSNLITGFDKVRKVLLFNNSEVMDLNANGGVMEIDDHLAGNQGDLAGKPRYDPSVFTERSMPGLEDYKVSLKEKKAKKDQVVEDGSTQDPTETGLVDENALEDGKIKDEKVKDEKVKDEKVKDEKEKSSNKDKDKIKKDKDKDNKK